YGTHHQPAGTWSDDTSMSLATIAGLLDSSESEPDAVMRRFVDWVENGRHTPHGEIFDIGNATRAAIRRYQSGTPLKECGGAGEGSNGNGSLMRILPVALAYADDPSLIDKAAEFSALTHAHERSRFCCAFYCLVASDLLHGSSIRGATAFAWEVLDHRWTFSEGERSRFEALRPDRLFSRDEDAIGSSGHVIETLEASLWVNDRHDRYAEAVLHAVNLGDDTDTTACVAGGLAGLIHGESGIPDEWREGLVKRTEIERVADSVAALGDRERRRLMPASFGC
ncbi:MAG: ADP-ribosylglycohydrolase family protein, partial [Verrucomicrobiae bacterium]|nr:ADP-ribosylglycohydrolase family protein [Verrucomicrobiae bacterium]